MPPKSPESIWEDVRQEVDRPWRLSQSPRLSEPDLDAAISTLRSFLAQPKGDPDYAAIGDQIESALREWFGEGKLVKMADRSEPFCKAVLQFIRPQEYEDLQRETADTLSLSKVLKKLGLVRNSDLQLFAMCKILDDLPEDKLRNRPDFLIHVARAYVARNPETHRARELSRTQKAEVAQSFCVLLVWTIHSFRKEIDAALLTARCRGYLERLRTGQFEKAAGAFVQLLATSQGPSRGTLPSPPTPDSGPTTGHGSGSVFDLACDYRALVFEAASGAGKTSTLRYLAHRVAGEILTAGVDTRGLGIPVYLELKSLKHCSETIRAAVARALTSEGGPGHEIPWPSLLLLVDGLNEIGFEDQDAYLRELTELLDAWPSLRAVLTTRENSVPDELPARRFLIQPLSDDQLTELIEKTHANSGQRVRAILAADPKLLAWARNPLHAKMLGEIADGGTTPRFRNRAALVEHFLQRLMARERGQSSAVVTKTPESLKLDLLSRLAFETKRSSDLEFGSQQATSLMSKRGAERVAIDCDLALFLEEVIDNHLLERTGPDALRFSHELYHDFFGAAELRRWEKTQPGLGLASALQHFVDLQWREAILLFAQLTSTSRDLAERGASDDPFLAWKLVEENGPIDPELERIIAEAAYCIASSGALDDDRSRRIAECTLVLAMLERDDLLQNATAKLSSAMVNAAKSRENPEGRPDAAEPRRTLRTPIALAHITIYCLAANEEARKEPGRFQRAAQAIVRGLAQARCASLLEPILDLLPRDRFSVDSPSLSKTVLDALIELEKQNVLQRWSVFKRATSIDWLRYAAESGYTPAWPAFGRAVRLAGEDMDDPIIDETEALKWLRRAEESGDEWGSAELALLFLDWPDLSGRVGEGEDRLRRLAIDGNLQAQFELGMRLTEGRTVTEDKSAGFEALLTLAELGCRQALIEIQCLCLPHLTSLITGPDRPQAPQWMAPHRARILAVFARSRKRPESP